MEFQGVMNVKYSISKTVQLNSINMVKYFIIRVYDFEDIRSSYKDYTHFQKDIFARFLLECLLK